MINQIEQSHYLSEIHKLKDYLNDREAIITEQMMQLDHLVSENNFLKTSLEREEFDSISYKETLKNMYVIYIEQQKMIENFDLSNKDLSTKVNFQSDKNKHLINEIENIIQNNSILQTKLKEGDKKFHYDIQSLTHQLNDKNIELADKRRNINDLLEIKRRLEEETAALRFTLENIRQKTETDTREKQVRQERNERQHSETVSLQNEELMHLKRQIKESDILNKKKNDQNKTLFQEINVLKRQLELKEDEINAIKKSITSGGFFDVMRKDNVQNLQDQQVQQITQKILKNNELISSMKVEQNQEQIEENTENNNKITKKNIKINEDLNTRKIYFTLDSHISLHQKLDEVIKINQNSIRKKLLQVFLNLWKAKYSLSLKERSEAARNKKEYNKENNIFYKGEEEKNENPDTQLSGKLTESTILLLQFIRRSTVTLIFELYQRSQDTQENKKVNSLILFTVNLKDFKNQFKGIEILLQIYNKLVRLFKQFIEDLKKIQPQSVLIPKITVATGKLLNKNNNLLRSQQNKWIEQTLNQAISEKLSKNKEETNKEILFLFRLLTLKHKIKYPLQGNSYITDIDIENALEHKICEAFRKSLYCLN